MPAMDEFVARQPVLDEGKNIFAYILTLPSGLGGVLSNEGAETGSSGSPSDDSGLSTRTQDLDLGVYTSNSLGLVPVTLELQASQIQQHFPKDSTALVLPRTVEPKSETTQAISALKSSGFQIVLDHFTYTIRWESLIPLADIIIVDFLACKDEEKTFLPRRYASQGARVLAKNIENWAMFRVAQEAGCKYFHGRFYRIPTIIGSKDVPSYKLQCLNLMSEINRPELDTQKIEDIIKREVTLTFKLLRYINSAFFGRREKVDSIRHALLLMGQREIKKWASLVAFKQMADDRPNELMVDALVRARFCESLASLTGMPDRDQELFFMGMLSFMDAILGRPMKSILGSLPIADDIKEALCGESNKTRDVLECAVAYEDANWDKLFDCVDRLGVERKRLPALYREVLQWAGGSSVNLGQAA
jgi:EAL and modified HD-GYP domain-containing signal transduction protein